MAQPGQVESHRFEPLAGERLHHGSHPARSAAAVPCELIQRLAPDERNALLAAGVIRRFTAGEAVCRKGDVASHLYVLLRGRLKVATSGCDGRSITLALLEPGELFGEIAAFDDAPRTASVIPIEPSEVQCISRQEFFGFLERYPPAAVKVLTALAAKMRRLSDVVDDALFLDLPHRLARKLLVLADAYGTPGERGVRIALPLSQRDLGELVAVSRESVNKQLRCWGDRGILCVADLRIEILRRDALERLADPLRVTGPG